MNAGVRHKTELVAAQRDAAQADSALKQRSLVFTVIGLVLAALLALAAFRNTRIKQKANKLLTLQKQQVQQLADQLAVANETKARLFSTIGHDLRSPVSSLYASLKMQELKGNAIGDEMSEQTVRLLDTLEELLVWSKSQMEGFTLQPVKINVRYLFQDLIDFYAAIAVSKGVTIISELKEDMIIRTDENLLKTILRNAISNAITNTFSGSKIILNAMLDAENKTVLTVTNPCKEDDFFKFQSSFNNTIMKSGSYGLGIILIKEFSQKIGADVSLIYTANNAVLAVSI